MTRGSASAYRYAASGDRTWRRTPAGTELVALDGPATVGVFTSAGTLVEWNVLANGAPIGRQPAAGDPRQYYHAEALGSVRVVAEATGTAVGGRDFDPWGVVL
jgi:hypothetical protein